MDINILRNIFMFISTNIILVGLSMNILEPYLPILMKHIFLYGKFGIKPPYAIAAKLEVPKR